MKTNIIIKEENRERLFTAIKKVEARARVRTIMPYEIFEAVKDIEAKLKTLEVLKKNWAGMRFTCDPNAQSFPNAYKGTPESTGFEIVRTKTNWKVTAMYRSTCNSKEVIFRNENEYTQFYNF